MRVRRQRHADARITVIGLLIRIWAFEPNRALFGADTVQARPMKETGRKCNKDKNPRNAGQKTKARQWVLTSLIWFEPGCNSGVSGGGEFRTVVPAIYVGPSKSANCFSIRAIFSCNFSKDPAEATSE